MRIRELLSDAKAPAREAASAKAGVACYMAASPSGPLLLELAASARHAADAAVALMRCDALLCALDEWAGLAIEWRWIEKPFRLSPGSHVRAGWRTPDMSHGFVELPWKLLRGLDAPPAELAAMLDWPTLPAVLAASQLRLPLEELRRLEPGGAIVLPESLSTPWHGCLRATDEPVHRGCGVAVDLGTPMAPRLARCAAHRAADDADDLRVACEVRLGTVHAVPADRLGGWCAGDTLDVAGATAELWRCAGICGPAQHLAAGRLMPWGDGWALALESLDEAEPTLIITR